MTISSHITETVKKKKKAHDLLKLPEGASCFN